MSKMIGIVVTHPGALNALLPVQQALCSKFDTVWFSYSEEKAAQMLLERGFPFIDYTALTNFPKIDILVAGVRGNEPGVELFMAQRAQAIGIPVVKVLDFWGSGMSHEKGFAPDRLCVLDEPSIEYEASMRKMPKANIRVTGNPAFDKLMEVDISQEAHYNNRKRLGIENHQFFIALAAPSSYERVMEILPDIIAAVKEAEVGSGKLVLCALWHPRDSTWSKYYHYLDQDQAKILYISDKRSRELMLTPEIYVAADLVVGVTSTETLISVYLRRPTLNIIYPGGVNFKDILAPREMKSIPTVEAGAAFLAESAQEVKYIINDFFGEGLIYNHKMLAQGQESFKLDGQNTARVVKVIEELL